MGLESLIMLKQQASDRVYVEDVFSTYLYAGNSSTQNINNGIDLAGKGGLVWIKSRSSSSASAGHALFDTARGRSYGLATQSTAAQVGPSSTGSDLDTFNSNGFTVAGNNNWALNASGITYASWTFRKAPKFFDIVTVTGQATQTTFNHNLGVAPGFIVIKDRNNTGTNWFVYHRSAGSNQYLQLENTTAQGPYTGWCIADSTSVTIKSGVMGNGISFVVYLFAHDTTSDSVIQCGTYTGNGTTQEVNLGWEPQWLLTKMIDNTGSESEIQQSWRIVDNLRGMPLDLDNAVLLTNTSGAENVSTDTLCYSPTATGFKVLSQANQSGKTFVFVAIRRGPMRIPTSGTSVHAGIARSGIGSATELTPSIGGPSDLVYIKNRLLDGVESVVADRNRGNEILSSSSTAGGSSGTNILASNPYAWTSMTGVRVGAEISTFRANKSGELFLNYFFRRAPSFFDIVCYTGDGTNGRSLSHNLGVAPEMIIVKDRNGDGTFAWLVGHKDIGGANYQDLQLRSSAGVNSLSVNAFPSNLSGYSSTSFIVNQAGLSGAVNGSSTNYVAYLFASCPGVSKVGSYTGNGSSQTINCGFAAGARFVLIKRISAAGDWYLWDNTAHGIVAGNDSYFSLNTNLAEVSISNDSVDLDSTGFIVNQVTATNINVNAATYIYLAIS